MELMNSSGETTVLVEKKSWIEEQEIAYSPLVSCFVLLENSNIFSADEKSYNLQILGQPMFTWVTRACPAIPVTIEVNENVNPLEVIRPYLKDAEYTVVLYSDTPLVKKSTIEDIIDYVKNKGLNVCKLSRGWVYKTEYIKRVGEVFAPQTYCFKEDEFFKVCDTNGFDYVKNILKNRLIDFHIKNGVQFTEKELVVIDANVSIGRNTIIYGCCKLLSKSQIGENCKIFDSKIVSSKICDGVNICGATIDKSVIENDCLIKENTIISNRSLVKSNTVIFRNNDIEKTYIGENVKIGHNNIISSARIDDLCNIESANILAGKEKNVVRILSNSTIGSGCKIDEGVVVREGGKIDNFTQLKNKAKLGEDND